jgi:hypothetical protein
MFDICHILQCLYNSDDLRSDTPPSYITFYYALCGPRDFQGNLHFRFDVPCLFVFTLHTIRMDKIVRQYKWFVQSSCYLVSSYIEVTALRIHVIPDYVLNIY